MRVLAAILALALLLAVPAEAQIRLPSIKNRLIELALDQISSPGSFEVTAGAVEDLEGGVTSLVDVRVSDGEGVWLSLERLNFAWAPDRLLAGELAITKLELIGLDVARPPSEAAEPPELKPQEPWQRGPFDWPRAPISVTVEGLRIERARIAEGVLPQAIRFDAEGRAVDKGELQEVALDLRRTDAIEGRIGLLMRRDFAAGALRMEVSASEAPGGLVAAAAGFPPDAPARLELTADGTAEDWRLDFQAAVERVFEAGGRATLSYAERLNAEADFSVRPGPGIGPELRAVLGEEARLRARVVERPDGMIEVLAGELVSPAVRLRATGALATGAGQSDLAVSLEALAPLADLVEGVAFERFTFDGRVTGPRGALVAEGRLGLDRLATAPVEAGGLRLDGRVAQTAEGFGFDLAGHGEGLRLDRVGSEVIGLATLEAAGALMGGRLTLRAARLESEALGASASGSYDIGASAGALVVRLEAPDIAPVAAAYGVAAAGAVAASAEVALRPDGVGADVTAALERFAMAPVAAGRLTLAGRLEQAGNRLGFDLAGGAEAVALGQVPRQLTGEVSYAARGAVEAGAVDLAELRLSAPLVRAEASGRISAGEGMALDYALATPDLGLVAAAYGADAAGALEARGRAEGPPEAPRLAGEVALTGAAFAGRPYGTVALRHDLTLGAVPEGQLGVTLDGSWLGDARAETRFRLDGPRLALAGFKARVAGVAAEGEAGIDLDALLAEGRLGLDAPELGPVGRLAGVALGGSASGEVTFAPAEGRQAVRAALTGRGLGVAGVEAAGATLRLAVADALGTPRLDVEARAEGVAAGPLRLEAASATAGGPLSALDFSAEARGVLREQPLTAALAGRADADGAPAVVSLARAELTAGADGVRLERPLRLAIGEGLVAAEGLALALPGGGRLTGEAAARPGGFTGDLVLEGLALEAAGRWAEVPVTAGRLDVRAAFDTRAGRARGQLAARGRGVVLAGAEVAGRGLDADLDAGWDGARLDARGELRGFGEPFRVRLALPLRPAPGGLPVVPPRGAIDGDIDWSGRIGDLWALVPAPGHILDGEALIDLSLGGSLEAPAVSGRAEVRRGQYQNLDAGTILTDLSLDTRITGDGAVGMTLEAADGAAGRVAARGELRLGGGPPGLDVTATSERAVLVRRDDVTAALSGEVALAGTLDDLALRGALTVDRAEVRLVNATPPEVVELDGIRLKGAPEEAGEGDGESVVRLDLTIGAQRDIFVRGRGLDSEWRMDLRVRGDAARPVVSGVVEKVRGRFALLGRPFELARGRVAFDGGAAIDPELDVYLEREDHGIRGGIVVSGRASAPELGFASTPALPEDEVLPRLLFGQSRQSLTGAQALQLAAGLATLMGGEAGPIDALREAAGLDVLRVEGETVEEAAVTVGRNVGEGIFIGARQGLGGQGSAVTVEVEVFEGVSVDSEFGQEGNSSFGITLRRDF
jgi:autotransporter translocation and assembly factor TamB